MTFYGQLDSINDEFVLADVGLVFVFVCFDCFTSMSVVPTTPRRLSCRPLARAGPVVVVPGARERWSASSPSNWPLPLSVGVGGRAFLPVVVLG
jgi:hypothetical protein